MTVLLPTTIADAVVALSEHRSATVLAGGTDSMVEINQGRARPLGTVVALHRIGALRSWRHDPAKGIVTLGAGITWTDLLQEPLADLLPALAQAARTVGSPQIRNAGTLGGNLATCSPAGDGLPVLTALDAEVEVHGVGGVRTLVVREFMVGVKRTQLGPSELIASVTVPVVDGWQGYAKVGVRNAMVIAVASACVVLDRAGRAVRVALGSVGPTVLRCPQAELQLSAAIDWSTSTVEPAELAAFASSVAEEIRPITDHRATADYRRHAAGVLARRLATRGLAALESP